jgi:hypothetical protein
MRKDKLIERNDSPELTWEEKNPISYYYYSSDAIERLKVMLEEEKEVIKMSNLTQEEKEKLMKESKH